MSPTDNRRLQGRFGRRDAVLARPETCPIGLGMLYKQQSTRDSAS